VFLDFRVSNRNRLFSFWSLLSNSLSMAEIFWRQCNYTGAAHLWSYLPQYRHNQSPSGARIEFVLLKALSSNLGQFYNKAPSRGMTVIIPRFFLSASTPQTHAGEQRFPTTKTGTPRKYEENTASQHIDSIFRLPVILQEESHSCSSKLDISNL
jgi:hypothetical protein